MLLQEVVNYLFFVNLKIPFEHENAPLITRRLTPALAAVVLFACKKEEKSSSVPVQFSNTTYAVLTPYDSTTGKPLGMIKDTISADMLSYISTLLPEKQDLRNNHPELLNSNTAVDLSITQHSDVYLTFVSTVTSYRNAIAFYTYATNKPPAGPKDIAKITYVLPSAGVGTKLKAGDKLKLGTFEAGTSIGLVILKDAFDPTTGALNNNAVHFCYNDALNPEVDPALKKHVVLINYAPENKILIGFENTDRTSPECDHDFNDAVLYATVTH